MKIVDDFTSADNVDQYKNKAKQIVDYWLGDNHSDSFQTWGDLRQGLNQIPHGDDINNYDFAESVLVVSNQKNNSDLGPDNAVRTINSIIYVSRDL